MPHTTKTKVVVRRKKKTVDQDRRAMTKAKKERAEARRVRAMQALELRAGGANYEQIAQALGLSNRSHAMKVVEGALEKFEIEAAKQTVKLDLARLDEYMTRCTYALRQNGDLNQIDRLMRIMEFRYRLLGISNEDVRELRAEHGVTNINIQGGVQVVQARAETETEFIQKMMGAVGVDPNSEGAQKYLKEREAASVRALPMLKGSANSDRDMHTGKLLPEDEADVVDAEIVE